MTIDEVLALAVEHKWTLLAATLIGAVVRLLKSDVPITPTIPARWRPWLAVGLGLVAGLLEKVAAGVPWASAVFDGLSAALVAIAGHDLLINSARSGREVLATRPTTETIPVLPVLLLALTASFVGCAPASSARSPERATVRAAILTVAEAVKVADHACADVARNSQAPQIARTCADAYDAARPALLAAESGVDAWEAGQQHDVACAASKATHALQRVAEAIIVSGAKPPGIIEDALRLTSALGLGGLCDAG